MPEQSTIDTSGIIRTGWVKADNKLIREIIADTNAQTAMLYLIILSHRNTNTGNCFPSINTLAKEMNISDRSIERMLNSLSTTEVLRINSGKEGKSNTYYFPKESFFEEDGTNSMAHKRKTGFRKKAKPKANIRNQLGLPKETSTKKSKSVLDDDDYGFSF